MNVCTHNLRYQRYAALLDFLQTHTNDAWTNIQTKVGMNIRTKTQSKEQTKLHTSGHIVKKKVNFNVSAKEIIIEWKGICSTIHTVCFLFCH